MSAIRLIYGPTGIWLGSQSSRPPSVNGVEPSPGLRSLAPGQRSVFPVSSEPRCGTEPNTVLGSIGGWNGEDSG